MSYASFRKQNNDLTNLRDKFNKLDGKRDFSEFDDTYWTTTHVAGAEGSGEAVVRFLPAPPDGQGGQEPDNIVKYFSYSIRKNGKSYINRGRDTLGKDEADPAREYNNSIWARTDIDKEAKKKQLVNRADYYIGNILVIKDPNKPENEGKVFRWRFGRQIYNLINKQLFPEFETDKPVNVFDPIEGANFHFRVVHKTIPDQVTGDPKKVPNYENSKFASPSQLCSLDEFDKIWEQEYSLQSEIAEDKFRSYAELKQQFDRVMGLEAKSFLDTDEPLTPIKNASQEKSLSSTEQKSTAEAIDDEVPWFNDDKEEEKPLEKFGGNEETIESVDDTDDWFSKIS